MDRLPPRIPMPTLVVEAQTYEISVFGDDDFPMFFDIDTLQKNISTPMSHLFPVKGFKLCVDSGSKRNYRTYYTWEGVRTLLLYHGRIDLINAISRWAGIQ